jgi:hypothetical protein
MQEVEARHMMHAEVVNLAWELADMIAPSLDEETRTAMFATLGAGEPHAMIIAVLTAYSLGRIQQEPDLAMRVCNWADCFLEDDVAMDARQELRDIIGDAPRWPRNTPTTVRAPGSLHSGSGEMRSRPYRVR